MPHVDNTHLYGSGHVGETFGSNLDQKFMPFYDKVTSRQESKNGKFTNKKYVLNCYRFPVCNSKTS